MNVSLSFLTRWTVKVMAVGLMSLLLSCGEEKEEQSTNEVLVNDLAIGPTDFTRRYQHSKINWQNWDEHLFKKAKKQQKPVMVFLSSGQYTESFIALESLEESKELQTKLEENFISCFVDTQAYPELGTLAYNLSVSNGRFSFPFVIWFSPDGDPLSWHPLLSNTSAPASQRLLSIANSVGDTWTRDPEYSLKHSQSTNIKLLDRHRPTILDAGEEVITQEESYRSAIRSLLALYDPVEQSLDKVGSLIPYSLLELLDRYHDDPEKDAHLDRRAQELMKAVVPSYLNTPLKDPVDKGFFYAKFGKGWDLPNYVKTLNAQSALVSLLSSPTVASSFPKTEKYKQEALTYIDENLTNLDQTIAAYEVVEGMKDAQDYHLWSEEELKALLSESEYKAVNYMSQIRTRGNVSETSDPTKKYYRKNTLAELSTRSEAAKSLGMKSAVLAQTLDSAWRKIDLAREKRGQQMNYAIFKETTASVKEQARAAYAYLLSYQGAGNEAHLEKATLLLSLIKKRFWTPEGGLLRIVARNSASTSITARGLDYTVVIRAYLLSHKLTLSPDHLAFAQLLSKEAYEQLADKNGFLQEVHRDEFWCRGEIYSFLMLFEDSTLGTLPLLSAQLGELTQDEALINSGKNSYKIMERGMKELAVVHTDFLKNYPVRLREIIILTGDPADPQTQALQKVLQRPEFVRYQFIHYSKQSTAEVTLKLKSLQEPAIHLFQEGIAVGTAQSRQELNLLLERN